MKYESQEALNLTLCMHNTDLEVDNNDPEVKRDASVIMVQCNEDML